MAIPIIEAQLIVSSDGELEPDTMCRELGIQPIRVWRVGDRIGRTILREKTNGWLLSTGKVQAYEIGPVAGKLLELPEIVLNHLSKMASENVIEIEISIAVEATDEMPSISFDRKLLSCVERLSASIDVDII